MVDAMIKNTFEVDHYRITHITHVWHVFPIYIDHMLVDDVMAISSDFFAVFPLNVAPSALSDDGMVHFPSFEVDGQPCAGLAFPKAADFLKYLADRHQIGVCSLEATVVFLDILDVKIG